MTGAKRISRLTMLLGCSLIICLADVGAQSLLLDADLKAGYQGANVVRPLSSGDQITVELIGKNVDGVDGFSIVLNYDPALLSYTSFQAGSAIPGLTGLQLPGNGAVEVGGASISGAAGEGTLRLGTVTFTVAGAIGSSEITVGNSVVTVGGSEVAVTETSSVAIQTDPAAITLDGNADTGQQGATVVDDVTPGQTILVELIGDDLTGVSGYSATLTYGGGLVYDGFTAGDVIPGFSGLQLTGDGQVEIGGASVRGSSSTATGRLAVARFIVGSAFDGDATITLAGGKFSSGAGETVLDLSGTVSVRGTAAAATPDFDGDGEVGFSDFLVFAGGFGKRLGDPDFNAALDLDKDGEVGFGDFLEFAAAFGQTVGAGKPTLSRVGANNGATAGISISQRGPIVEAVVDVGDLTGISGVLAELDYDPAQLAFVSATRADGSPFDVASDLPGILSSTSSAGRLTLGDAATGDATASAGAVFRIVFDRIGAGVPAVELDLVRVFDRDGSANAARIELPTGERGALAQNIPNPFNPQTQISYTIPEDGPVNLTVFSESGQRIAVLVDRPESAGRHRVVWDGRDVHGRDVASGVYFYRLAAPETKLVRKMVLLR